jgi:ABC-type amino acid transport system permease subunit
MNYATVIALATPFVCSLVTLVVARGAKCSLLATLFSALGGFIIGFCFGAMSAGLGNVLLSVRNKSPLGHTSVVILYLLLPLLLLAMACSITIFGMRWLL